MRPRPPRFVNGRAIIGVIALYALVLQAFLTALAPTAALAQARPADILCAEHAEGAGAPGDHGPACLHHACCLHAQGAELGLPPTVAAFAQAVWPRETIAPTWPAATTARARAPPDPAIGPRGPPAA